MTNFDPEVPQISVRNPNNNDNGSYNGSEGYTDYMGEQNPAFTNKETMPELPSGKSLKDATIAL